MKKKVALTAAAVALVGTLAVGGTLAWFTDTEEATNVVTIGNVDIQWNEDGTRITENTPGQDFGTNKVPGASFDKNARIDNVGKNPAYVRATISYQIDDGELVSQVPDGYAVEILADNENNKWAYNTDDGYYYYLDELATNAYTDYLVGKVSIPAETTQGQIHDETFRVILNAEAIQSENVAEDAPETLADYVAIFTDKNIENGFEGESGK